MKKIFPVSLLILICAMLGMCNESSSAATTTNKFTLGTSSYVYNSKGKRVTKKLMKKGTKVNFIGKIRKTNKVKNYYIFKNPLPNWIDNPIKENLYWLPYKKIKGKLYYKIKKNKYIRCINIEKINEYYVYVPQSTVTVADPAKSAQKKIYAQNKTGFFTSHVLKKGSKLVVDEVVGLEHSQSAESYHIKGTKLYIYAGDIVKRPRGLIQAVEMHNKNAFITLDSDSFIYDKNGGLKEPKDRILLSQGIPSKNTFKVDKLKYIWNSKENVAELYYHLTNNQEVYTYTPNTEFAQPAEIKTKDDYIKFDNTKFIQGLRLKPSNTPTEAKVVYGAKQE